MNASNGKSQVRDVPKYIYSLIFQNLSDHVNKSALPIFDEWSRIFSAICQNSHCLEPELAILTERAT